MFFDPKSLLNELNIKDSIVIAVLGWIVVSAVSGLPFMIHGSIPSFTDAFFEFEATLADGVEEVDLQFIYTVFDQLDMPDTNVLLVM